MLLIVRVRPVYLERGPLPGLRRVSANADPYYIFRRRGGFGDKARYFLQKKQQAFSRLTAFSGRRWAAGIQF
ncbi:MAG TPA: hypothetical protein H9709_00545 [Candidatus Gemmiger stercoripullorum]|nr:hypothetical protein [Candidatus Gemmiger stercoripullorum]